MKTIFDSSSRQALIERIDALNENSPAQWGHMNVCQMVKHCSMFDEWIQGKSSPVYKQAFIGRILGKIALKGLLKDEAPMKRNMVTIAAFKIKEQTGDIPALKARWISTVRAYEHFFNPGFVHTFFGKMSNEEIGLLVYKHTDHHLRQFNS